jgi:hypothetical protein
MARQKRAISQDLSSFMCIILMVIGVMIIILIVNVVLIISNPENIRITSLIQSAGAWNPGQEPELGGGQPFPFGNRSKEPVYVDVQKEYLVLYPSQEIVSLRDLERTGNAFESLLNDVEGKKEQEYVILLARPGTAPVFHRLKRLVLDRGIDLGWELFEADRPVEYERAAKASGKIK